VNFYVARCAGLMGVGTLGNHGLAPEAKTYRPLRGLKEERNYFVMYALTGEAVLCCLLRRLKFEVLWGRNVLLEKRDRVKFDF
jgi:hypothetical protein